MYVLNSRLFLTYPKPSLPYIEQLMNEAEYLMKNYGDQGGCYSELSSCCSCHVFSYYFA